MSNQFFPFHRGKKNTKKNHIKKIKGEISLRVLIKYLKKGRFLWHLKTFHWQKLKHFLCTWCQNYTWVSLLSTARKQKLVLSCICLQCLIQYIYLWIFLFWKMKIFRIVPFNLRTLAFYTKSFFKTFFHV